MDHRVNTMMLVCFGTPALGFAIGFLLALFGGASEWALPVLSIIGFAIGMCAGPKVSDHIVNSYERDIGLARAEVESRLTNVEGFASSDDDYPPIHLSHEHVRVLGDSYNMHEHKQLWYRGTHQGFLDHFLTVNLPYRMDAFEPGMSTHDMIKLVQDMMNVMYKIDDAQLDTLPVQASLDELLAHGYFNPLLSPPFLTFRGYKLVKLVLDVNPAYLPVLLGVRSRGIDAITSRDGK